MGLFGRITPPAYVIGHGVYGGWETDEGIRFSEDVFDTLHNVGPDGMTTAERIEAYVVIHDENNRPMMVLREQQEQSSVPGLSRTAMERTVEPGWGPTVVEKTPEDLYSKGCVEPLDLTNY